MCAGSKAARLQERLTESRAEVAELQTLLGERDQQPLTEEHRRRLREHTVSLAGFHSCLYMKGGACFYWLSIAVHVDF